MGENLYLVGIRYDKKCKRIVDDDPYGFGNLDVFSHNIVGIAKKHDSRVTLQKEKPKFMYGTHIILKFNNKTATTRFLEDVVDIDYIRSIRISNINE